MKYNVDVKTNKNKSEILEIKKGYFQVNLKSIPQKGKANAELLKLFKKKFKKQVRIVKGLTNSKKIIEVLP